MAPLQLLQQLFARDALADPKSVAPSYETKAKLVQSVEAWSEGFNFGGLFILMLIVVCNLRRHILLHKLILLEQFLAMWHGTTIFVTTPVWGWYNSSAVALLYISYFVHNVVSWMKIKPFLSKRGSWIFMGSLLAAQPYWIFALSSNYAHFNSLRGDYYVSARPYETLAREPWWVFTTIYLVYIVKRYYSNGFKSLIRSSPRFGVLLLCMFLSIVFAIVDAVVTGLNLNHASGINPYWRISLVFKCAADCIFLDDFKKVLDVVVYNAMLRADTDLEQKRTSMLRSSAFFNRPANDVQETLDQDFAKRDTIYGVDPLDSSDKRVKKSISIQIQVPQTASPASDYHGRFTHRRVNTMDPQEIHNICHPPFMASSPQSQEIFEEDSSAKSYRGGFPHRQPL